MGKGSNVIFLETKHVVVSEMQPLERKLFELLAERKQIQDHFRTKRDSIK